MERKLVGDVEIGYPSTSHSSLRIPTHGCDWVRRYHETLSQHTPAMKEWIEEVASSSDCQKGCPKGRMAEHACVKREGQPWIMKELT